MIFDSLHIRFRVLALMLALFSISAVASAFTAGEAVYLQFPLVGKALYTDGTNVMAGNYDAAGKHEWTYVDDVDGNTNTWKLKYGTHYLKASSTGLTLTATEGEATSFTLSAPFTYQTVTANRYNLSFVESDVTYYLSVDESGAISMSTTSTGSHQVLRLPSGTLEGPSLPKSSSWYRIYFPFNDKYMDGAGTGSGDEATVKTLSTMLDNYNTLWQFVYTDGKVQLKNKNGKYLKKGTGDHYVMTATPAEATSFRLIEDIDGATVVKDDQTGKGLWRLRREDAYTNYTMHQPFGGYDYLGDWSADSPGNFFSLDEVVVDPLFFLQFPVSGKILIDDGGTLKAGNYEDLYSGMWVLADDGDAHSSTWRVKSLASSAYLKATSTGIELTATEGEATSFSFPAVTYQTIRSNRYNLSYTLADVTYYVCVDETGAISVSHTVSPTEDSKALLRWATDLNGPQPPKYSDESNSYWYPIHFPFNHKYLKDRGDNTDVSTSDYDLSAVNDLHWKFVKSPTEGYFYLINRNGRYLCKPDVENYQYYATTSTEAEASLFALVEDADNTTAVNGKEKNQLWLLRRKDSGDGYMCHNPFGGYNYNQDDSSYYLGDYYLADGNYFDFDWTAHLQFPLVGKALYTDGTNVMAGNYDAAGMHEWTFVEDGDADSHTWRIRKDDKYLKASSTGLTLTATASSATSFTLSDPFTYQTVTANRYNLSFKDGSTYYLSVDESGNISMSTTASPQQDPKTVLRLAVDVKGPQPPKYSDGSNSYWYPIHFPFNNQFLKDAGAGADVNIGEFERSGNNSQWKFVKSPTEGYCYLVNKSGNYLKKGTGDYYVTTATEAEASLFALVEDADNNSSTGGKSKSLMWRLHRQGSTDAYTLHQPYGEVQKAGDWDATSSGNYFDFYWTAYLQYPVVGKALYTDGSTVTAGNYDATGMHKWNFVDDQDDSADTWKIMKDGKYLKYNATGLELTATESEASSFTLNRITYLTLTLDRYELKYGSKYLKIKEDGSISWTASSNTDNQGTGLPYNVLRLGDELVGPELPTFGTADSDYRVIRFANSGKFLYLDTADSKVKMGDNDGSDKFKWTFQNESEDGYYIKSKLGDYRFRLVSDGAALTAEAANYGKFRLAEDADATGSIGGRPVNKLWRLRRRLARNAMAFRVNATDGCVYEKSDATDDWYFDFLNLKRISGIFSFPLEDGVALFANGSSISASAYDSNQAAAFQWGLQEMENGTYRLVNGRQYLALNAAKDGYVLTTELADALVVSFNASAPYKLNTSQARYTISFKVDETTTKYLGVKKGVLGMYDAEATRYTTIRIANDANHPVLPQIAEAGELSSVKWYQIHTYPFNSSSPYVVKDQGAGNPLKVTNRPVTLETSTLWKLTDTGQGNGNVYLESYLGHQPAGVTAVSTETYVAGTDPRTFVLQEDLDYSDAAYRGRWQLQDAAVTNGYLGGYYDTYWSPDGYMYARPHDWSSAFLVFEEVSLPYPTVFGADVAADVQSAIMFPGLSSPKYLSATAEGVVSLVETMGDPTVFLLIGEGTAFKIYSKAAGKYLTLNGTDFELTDTEAAATLFELVPNNSAIQERIVWSMVVKDQPTKALGAKDDLTGIELKDAIVAVTSAEFTPLVSDYQLVQFSANGRTLLKCSDDGNVVAQPYASDATYDTVEDAAKWGISGTDTDFVLMSKTGKFVSETLVDGVPALTTTTLYADAVHFKRVENTFNTINKSSAARTRYDFCKLNDESQRLAIVDERTGKLGWSTTPNTRYSTLRVAGDIQGPVVMPASMGQHLDHANDLRWYKLRFPNLARNQYLTSSKTMEAQVTNSDPDADPKLQYWRFEKVLSPEGRDEGDYVLRDTYNNYLAYFRKDNANWYRITDQRSLAVRMRLVEGADETGTTGGVALQTMWRLHRVEGGATVAMHPAYNASTSGGTKDVGEYNAAEAKNYIELTEVALSFAGEDDFITADGDPNRVIKFVMEGNKALFNHTATGTVQAKLREQETDDFNWGLVGNAAAFKLKQNGQYLYWNGTAFSMTDEASATSFQLVPSTYDLSFNYFCIASADGDQVLTVGADGAVTLSDFVCNRNTTIQLATAQTSTAARADLFTDNTYCRVLFKDAPEGRLTLVPAKRNSINSVVISSGTIDTRNNVWNFEVYGDEKYDEYLLKNGDGAFLKGHTVTSNREEADVIHIGEGEDPAYWRIFFVDKQHTLVKDMPASPVRPMEGDLPQPHRIVNVGSAGTGCNVAFSLLSDDDVNNAMLPTASDAESGNVWYSIKFNQAGNVVLNDGRTQMPAGTAALAKEFTQIWRIVRKGEAIQDGFILQSAAGNYLKRVETVEAEITTVTYVTTLNLAEATVFDFRRVGTSDYDHWELLVKDSDEENPTALAAGAANRLEDGTTTADNACMEFTLATWYLESSASTVLHKRNAMYDQQGYPVGAVDEKGHVLGIDVATGLQSTNEYELTLCLKKGQTVSLESPTFRSAAEFRHTNYQRWYDYTTESIPSNGVLSLTQDWRGTQEVMAFNNGLVLGECVTSGYTNGRANFTMPENAGETVEGGAVIPSKYTIAFEMSRYGDVSGFDNPAVDPTEPSLQLRAKFLIYEGKTMADYLKAYPADGGVPAEHHAITFPTQVHGTAGYGSGYSYQYEVVPMEMQASSYFCWNETDDDYLAPGLLVELEDAQGTGILFRNGTTSTTITGNSRLIEFVYPHSGRLENADGKQVKFKVYTNPVNNATKCFVAEYVITFNDGVDAMLLKDVIGNKTLNRSPEYMNEHYGTPTAQLTFDDDTSVFKRPDTGAEVANTAGKPFDFWSQVSYAYYPVRETISSSDYDAAWGEYAFIRQFKHGFGGTTDTHPIFFDLSATYSHYYKALYDAASEADKPLYENDLNTYYGTSGKSGNMLYIDSSEKPGEIASLAFEGDLCPGSKMYFSAWIASGNDNTAASPASVIFDLIGVKSDGSETKIYSYCPGQIMGRYYYPETGTTWIPTVDAEYEGGWQQVFFTFRDVSGVAYNSYQLRIRNNCMNSAGGDILIDNVKVYISAADVTMDEGIPVCGSAVNFLKVTSNFDAMLNTTGDDEDDTGTKTAKVWYCFLSKKIFDDTYAATSDAVQAFNAALLGNPSSSGFGTAAYHHATYYLQYDKNPEFVYQTAIEGLGSGDIKCYRLVDAGGARNLVFMDQVSDPKLKAGEEFYVALTPDANISLSELVKSGASMLNPTNKCCVKSVFTLRPAVEIKKDQNENQNGNSVDVCNGASTTIRTELEGVGDSGYTTSHGIYHDWWLDYIGGNFGDQVSATGIHLVDALRGFRSYNPTAENLDFAVLGPADANHVYAFTQEMLDYLQTLVVPQTKIVEGVPVTTQAPLLLYRNVLNVTPTNDQLANLDENSYHYGNITVIPIEKDLLTAENVLYCYEPQLLRLTVKNSAPGMKVGIKGMTYPDAIDFTSLRLGTEQVKSLKTAELTVPVNKVVWAYAEKAQGVKSVDNAPVYLAGTNDPYYTYLQSSLTGDNNLYAVGVVSDFNIENNASDAREFKFRFNDDFTPKEGYYYMLRINYDEYYTVGNEPDETPCSGAAIFTLKIVPQYAKWNGSLNSDWTNDHNWSRADAAELVPDGQASLEASHPLKNYMDNATNGRSQGYVPMHFTNVLIPGDAANVVSLYDQGFTGTQFLTGLQSTATGYIEYDMSLDEGLACKLFNTNLCKAIALQDGGQLVHHEKLAYEKASVDCRLEAYRWYTLCTPLQDVYAGDWYVPSATGQQTTPYFSDIHYDTHVNNRYQPAVYQRGWDKSGATMYLKLGSTATEDVAIAADWSHVYNDVNVPYTLNGFSLKVEPNGMGYGNVLFRFPKADATYQYFTSDNPTAGDATNEATVSRTNPGKFQPITTVTFNNHTANNTYYLVGNPFPCGLSLDAFFNENKDALEPKVWIVTANGQQAAIKDESGWVVMNSDGTSFTGNMTLAPMQGFFVQKKAGTIQTGYTYTEAMMEPVYSQIAANPLLAPSRAAAMQDSHLEITATCADLSSSCVVRMREGASDSWQEGEDMECFMDKTLVGVPFVYTMADHMAATFNKRATMSCVPLGVECDRDAEVTLTFNGCESFDHPLYLFDQVTKENTLLTEGTRLQIQGASFGRYYIVSDITPEASELTENRITIEGHKVSISSPTAIGDVKVYDMGGRLVYHQGQVETEHHSFSLPTGVYTVKLDKAHKIVVHD